jgi:hypothetical protein
MVSTPWYQMLSLRSQIMSASVSTVNEKQAGFSG